MTRVQKASYWFVVLLWVAGISLLNSGCDSGSAAAIPRSPDLNGDSIASVDPAEPSPVVYQYLNEVSPADGFDFPVGPPDGKGYYDAQPFGENTHLGSDWNGVGGGNTDFGDSVVSIAHGIVFHARDEGPGWGNVVRILHNAGSETHPRYIESLYAHLSNFWVEEGSIVTRGESIGAIGDANGAYYAHLHLEIRDSLGMETGGGYSPVTEGFLDPTLFIQQNRPSE